MDPFSLVILFQKKNFKILKSHYHLGRNGFRDNLYLILKVTLFLITMAVWDGYFKALYLMTP